MPQSRQSNLESKGSIDLDSKQKVLDLKRISMYFSSSANSFMGYTVKKVIDIPVPSRDVTYQTLSGLK